MCERQHGVCEKLIPMATRRDQDDMLAARWPGNVTPKPTRPEGRGRSRGVRLPATSAWWQHEPRRRRWRGMNVAARCGCAQSQSPTAFANSPSMPSKGVGITQELGGSYTTTKMQRAEVLCFSSVDRLDSTSRSSARQSHRGCGLGGGWDAGAVSATAGRSFCLTRDGADLASSWRALDVVIEDLQRTRNFLSRLRLPHACDGGKAY